MSPIAVMAEERSEPLYHIYRRHPGRAKRAPGPISRLECMESWVPARRFAPSGMTAMFVGCKSRPARTRTSGRAALTDAGVDGGARADRNYQTRGKSR